MPTKALTAATALPLGVCFVGVDSLLPSYPNAFLFISMSISLDDFARTVTSVRAKRDKDKKLTAEVFWQTMLRSELAAKGITIQSESVMVFEDVSKITQVKSLDLTTLEVFVAQVLTAILTELASQAKRITYVTATGSGLITTVIA